MLRVDVKNVRVESFTILSQLNAMRYGVCDFFLSLWFPLLLLNDGVKRMRVRIGMRVVYDLIQRNDHLVAAK